MGLWQMLLVLLLGVAIGSVDKAMFVAVVVLGAVTWLVHKCMGCGGGGGDAGDNGGGGGGAGDSTAMQGARPALGNVRRYALDGRPWVAAQRQRALSD